MGPLISIIQAPAHPPSASSARDTEKQYCCIHYYALKWRSQLQSRHEASMPSSIWMLEDTAVNVDRASIEKERPASETRRTSQMNVV